MTPMGVFFTATFPFEINEHALCQRPQIVPKSVRLMRPEDALGDAACLKQHEAQKNRIAHCSPYRSNRIAACGDALDEHRIDRNTDQYEHPLKAHGEQGF